MELIFTRAFIKDYKRLPTDIQEKIDKKLTFLVQNIWHPSLRIKKARGYENVWEGSVTMRYRFFFRQAKDKYVLLRVGTHTELLGR